MQKVTIDHIRQAVEWAKTARVIPQPIDGKVRRYNQIEWDCGTSCCIWGAACIIAGEEHPNGGPSDEWEDQSELHRTLSSHLFYPYAALEDFEKILSAAGVS